MGKRSHSESPEDSKKQKKERKKSKKEKKSKEKKRDRYSDSDHERERGENITEKFVWRKKKEQEKKLGIDEEEAKRREDKRKEEMRDELEKLKKRRAEREIEMQLRDQEMMRQQRLKEIEMYGDLDAKEDEFHLEQAKIRAQIRIKNGRAKPIDILSMSMNLDNTDVEIPLEEPYKICNGLTLEESEELKQDIQLYLELEKESNLEFWQSMMIICEFEIEKLRSQAFPHLQSNNVVNSDIEAILANKNEEQLAILKKNILEKLSTEKNIDTEYWENLLKNVIVESAKAKIRIIHEHNLSRRLEMLRQKQKLEAENEQKKMAEQFEDLTKMEKVEQTHEEIEIPVSPSFVKEAPKEEVLDPKIDWLNLQKKRLRIKENRLVFTSTKVQEPVQPTVSEMDPEEFPKRFVEMDSEVFSDDEVAEDFNIEIPLEKQVYMWQDKYRPRKPKYFNRVHTGYEWNKYNQTHYDTDNPPPKVVQGYRFNIFYPHLINKNDTPTYQIVKDPNSPDGSTCIIKFKAGPPYEDIGFRIISKE